MSFSLSREEMYTDHITKRLGSEPLWCRIGTQQHLTNNTLHHVIHLPGLLLLFPPPILHVVDSDPYRADNCTQKALSLDATAQIRTLASPITGTVDGCPSSSSEALEGRGRLDSKT